MKSITTSKDVSNKSLFEEGYKKGYWDATRGITAKSVRHSLQLRSEAISSWQEGYMQGYQDGIRQTRRQSNNRS